MPLERIRQHRWWLAGIAGCLVVVTCLIHDGYRGAPLKNVAGRNLSRVTLYDLNKTKLHELHLSDLKDDGLRLLGLKDLRDPRLAATSVSNLRDPYLKELRVVDLRPTFADHVFTGDLRNRAQWESRWKNAATPASVANGADAKRKSGVNDGVVSENRQLASIVDDGSTNQNDNFAGFGWHHKRHHHRRVYARRHYRVHFRDFVIPLFFSDNGD